MSRWGLSRFEDPPVVDYLGAVAVLLVEAYRLSPRPFKFFHVSSGPS